MKPTISLRTESWRWLYCRNSRATGQSSRMWSSVCFLLHSLQPSVRPSLLLQIDRFELWGRVSEAAIELQAFWWEAVHCNRPYFSCFFILLSHELLLLRKALHMLTSAVGIISCDLRLGPGYQASSAHSQSSTITSRVSHMGWNFGLFRACCLWISFMVTCWVTGSLEVSSRAAWELLNFLYSREMGGSCSPPLSFGR